MATTPVKPIGREVLLLAGGPNQKDTVSTYNLRFIEVDRKRRIGGRLNPLLLGASEEKKGYKKKVKSPHFGVLNTSQASRWSLYLLFPKL